MAFTCFPELAGDHRALATGGFSSLEWRVVDLAGRDRPSSLGRPGPLTRAWRWISGRAVGRALADPRLEALRRIAVLSWWRGYAVPGHEVRAFTDAGWSLDQYEAVVNHIADRRPRRGR